MGNQPDTDVKYRINPDLAWRIIDNEIVILKIETTTYYSLNEVGAYLWRSLDAAPLSKNEMIETVLAEYDVTREAATSDIEELIKDLASEKLLIEAVSEGAHEQIPAEVGA